MVVVVIVLHTSYSLNTCYSFCTNCGALFGLMYVGVPLDGGYETTAQYDY